MLSSVSSRPNLLYDRWRNVAVQRTRERALVDLSDDRSWTFGELLAWSDRAPVPDLPVVCPQGHRAEFILDVLRGWRHQRLVCPLEPGQVAPPPHGLPPAWCHLKTTSATTGRARWVGFTATQLAADPDHLAASMGLRPDWPNLAAIPLAHSYGFSSLVLPLLLHGIPLILAPSSLPEAIRRAATGEASLTLPSVPFLWRSWLDAQAVPRSVRLAISAGAPLPLRLEQDAFDRLGLKIHNFYGATECGGIAYDATPTPRTDPTLVGTPIFGVQLTVRENDGCLVVNGPNVGSGYWPDPGPHAPLRDASFHTTDLARIQHGALYLLGRADDLINIAGRKVSPEDIEQAILRQPKVRQCVVFGVPRGETEQGDKIVAVVEAEAGLTRDSLEGFLVDHLPAWQFPKDWWFVDRLDVTDRGKIQRRAWRDRYIRQ